MTPRCYLVPPARFAPAVLSVLAILAAWRESGWFLAALPFIYLGSVCAQPNLNLANGCLAYLAMLAGFATLTWFRPLGLAILAGAMSGFYVSALEKRIRMRPAPAAEPGDGPDGGPAESRDCPGSGRKPPAVRKPAERGGSPSSRGPGETSS
jgi:hypothetical protein